MPNVLSATGQNRNVKETKSTVFVNEKNQDRSAADVPQHMQIN